MREVAWVIFDEIHYMRDLGELYLMFNRQKMQKLHEILAVYTAAKFGCHFTFYCLILLCTHTLQ